MLSSDCGNYLEQENYKAGRTSGVYAFKLDTHALRVLVVASQSQILRRKAYPTMPITGS
jgi:hypothetical protein